MRHALLLFLTAVLSGALEAATLHVPADFPTIQAAIDAAVAGDVVLVDPGSYPSTSTSRARASP